VNLDSTTDWVAENGPAEEIRKGTLGYCYELMILVNETG